jgi:hypothetical protein
MKRYFSWQLGTVIPLILAVTLIAEASCRLIPPARFAFRCWEVLINQDPTKSSAVFRPNAGHVAWRSYGDLAAMANLRNLREYRPEIFTSDELGFRNPPASCRLGPPEALLVGSSFSAGSGVADDQTLSARLRVHTGKRVYNAAGFGMDISRVRALARHFGMRRGLVVYEYLERYDVPPPPGGPTEPELAGIRRDAAGGIPAAAGGGLWDRWSAAADKWTQYSPLQIVARRACQRVQNDRLLPNPFARIVQARTLRDGSRQLFIPTDVENARRDRPVDHAAAYFAGVAAELRKEDLDLLVVLVPDKYSVYQPLVRDEQEAAAAPSRYLDRVEAQARAAGVPVVNLTAAFCREAEAGLARGQYLYWRDDTHWNPYGIDVAAREIDRVWKGLPPSQKPVK